MANTVRIKRRVTGNAGAPAALKSGELAYNMVDNTIYAGFGDDGAGNGTSVKAVAGEGAFAKLNSPHLTGTPTAPTATTGTNSTQVATTAFVTAAMSGAGLGDMLKSVYDTNNDGKVNAADAADAVPWTGVSGKPSTFTPSAHLHSISDVTNLQTTLDGKAPVSHTHEISQVNNLQTALNDKLSLSGGTLVGPLTLPIPAPSEQEPYQAVHRQFVEDLIQEQSALIQGSLMFAGLLKEGGLVETSLIGQANGGNGFEDGQPMPVAGPNNEKWFVIAHVAQTVTVPEAGDTFSTHTLDPGDWLVSIGGKWEQMDYNNNAYSKQEVDDMVALLLPLTGGNITGALYVGNVAVALSGHTHTIDNVTGLQAALDGKQAAGSYAAAIHSHAIADVTDLQTTLDGKAPTSHTHTTAQVTGLDAALAGKSNVGHGHAISDVTDLQTALDGKAEIDHTHNYSQITGLGGMATQNANAVAITGGSISGVTLDLTTIDGGVF